MKNSRYDNSLLLPIDFVHHNMWQPRYHPFECVGIAANTANQGNEISSSMLLNSRSVTDLAAAGLSWAFLSRTAD